MLFMQLASKGKAVGSLTMILRQLLIASNGDLFGKYLKAMEFRTSTLKLLRRYIETLKRVL